MGLHRKKLKGYHVCTICKNDFTKFTVHGAIATANVNRRRCCESCYQNIRKAERKWERQTKGMQRA